MTKATKKVAPKKKATKISAPTPAELGLPVKYDRIDVVEHSTATELGGLTPDDVVVMMGWETEKEYQKRKVEENPGTKPEHYLFGEVVIDEQNGITRPVHCVNVKGEKVVCWHNANNRPFDPDWCEALAYTILRGEWAGPLTVPGETINGETVRISKYGFVISGQHQLTALKLADEILQASRAKEGNVLKPEYPFWNGHEHCVIETLVVTGLSQDERIIRTVDYVKPRTVADMLFTMGVFRDSLPVKRKELTRMLSAAIDMLWDRTATQGYRTHPEIVGFLERHSTLLTFVSHLFDENRVDATNGGRNISKLKLSAGQASAICYLMATSGNEDEKYGVAYRNQSPPSEKKLDWGMLDKATEFWTRLASGQSFQPVRDALANLFASSPTHDKNIGLGGLPGEKLAILAAAWNVWKQYPGINFDDGDNEPPFSEDDLAVGGVLSLSYTDVDDNGVKLPAGKIKLIDVADFGGIDCPKKSKREEQGIPDAPTQEELPALREEARQRREKTSAKPNGNGEDYEGPLDRAAKLAQQKREEQAEKLREERARRLKK